MRISDWSSDVCSSDLAARHPHVGLGKVDESGANFGFWNTGGLGAGAAKCGDQRRLLLDGAPRNEFHHKHQPLCIEFAGIQVAALLQFVQRSEEHTSELQSLMRISYAVFCLKKKQYNTYNTVKHDEH